MSRTLVPVEKGLVNASLMKGRSHSKVSLNDFNLISRRKNTRSQVQLPAISDRNRLAKLHGFVADS